jgi:hypothetical protein
MITIKKTAMRGICFTAVLLLSLLDVTPAFSFESEHDVYGQVQSFTWKEFNDGERLLEESGPLYAVGYTGKLLFSDIVTLKPRAEVFGGEVEYDGQACNVLTGECFSVESDTSYTGFKTELDVGLQFAASETFSLEPFSGLGYRWWRREIEDTDRASGGTEIWRVSYWRLGLRGDYRPVEEVRTFAEFAVKLPISNEETAEDVGCFLGYCRDVDLEPGKETSYYAEAGLKYQRFKAVLFYEGLRFSESDAEPIGGGFAILQPKTEADIYGINLGWSF